MLDILSYVFNACLNLQNARASVRKNTSSVQSALLHMIRCAQVRCGIIIIIIIIVVVNNNVSIVITYFVNVNVFQNAEIIAATQNTSSPPAPDHKIVAAKVSLKIDIALWIGGGEVA